MGPRSRQQVLRVVMRQEEQSHLTGEAIMAFIPETTRQHMSEVRGDHLGSLARRMELPLSMPVHERPRQYSRRFCTVALLVAIVTRTRSYDPQCKKEMDLKKRSAPGRVIEGAPEGTKKQQCWKATWRHTATQMGTSILKEKSINQHGAKRTKGGRNRTWR